MIAASPGKARLVRKLVVSTLPRAAAHENIVIRGCIRAGNLFIPCVIGRGGVARAKREGDGRTPKGRHSIVGGFFRVGPGPRPRSFIPLKAIRDSDGWCDAPGNPNYNRPVRLPFPASHEKLWRDDGLYDLALVLDYNLSRRSQGRGSAIFFHLWRDDRSPTEGCVAVSPEWMRRLLPRLAPNAVIEIT